MAPFEALYGAPFRTPTCWTETGEKPLAGPETIVETEEKIQSIREHMRMAQNHQKQYVDKRKKSLEFHVWDMVMLRYQEMSEQILDRKIKKFRNKEVGLVKVQWRHHRGTDVTWEAEEEMRSKYPFLFCTGACRILVSLSRLTRGRADSARRRVESCTKARQEHTQGSGVPHIDSTSGSGSAGHGKHIMEG
ncbi:hypothetical protein L1887_24083 [Cichorium endivia]|nr:hypothetical protein L1887_24083 [Cichorium endivia]